MFPNITVEVETTPQACHDIYDDMINDICIIYIKYNETIYHYMKYGDMFPHITVEVETKPHVCHGSYLHI